MKKAAFIIMTLTILSKIFGLLRDMVLSYFYGTTNISDAYLVSDIVPGVIFGFIVAGLAAGFIPMYTQIEQEHGKLKADGFTSNTMNLLLVLSTIVILITFLFTDQIVKIFASGFDAETLLLTSKLTKIGLFSIYFTGLIAILSGYLQIKNNFVIPALIGLPLNVVSVAAVIISSKTNVLVLAVGAVIAAASQVVLMIPFMKKNNFRYEFKLEIKDKHLIKMMYIALPVIIGVSLDKINLLIDRTMASGLAVGGISALNYAGRLNVFVQAIFVWSITTALYPSISRMAAEKDLSGFKSTISESIVGISLFVLPLTAGSMIFSNPLISLLFGRGAFDSNAVNVTGQALFFYSIGMIGFGMRDILTKAFYSLQDTKTPMINATIGVIINIVFNLTLSRFMGINGLALATSISALVTTVLLFLSIRKRIGPFGFKKTSLSILKVLIASSLMCLFAKLSFTFLASVLNQNIALLIAIGIGCISYFVIIYFMKIRDVDLIVGLIKSKFGRGDA